LGIFQVATDILIRFLNAGLIDVGGDDAKLGKLRETAADLATALKKTPSKAAPFALIAFDPEAPACDSVVKEVVETLQRRWATYVNTFSGTPIAVIRAMLLDALVQAARDDERVGVAFVTSARNVLAFMEASNERAIWADVVSEVERKVDARAEAEWATPSSITIPAMEFEAPEASSIGTTKYGGVNKAQLTKQILAAAGPNSGAGYPTGGNPYWPQNNVQQWAQEFSTRLADAIANTIDELGESTGIEPVDVSGPLKSFAQAVSAHVDGTLKAVRAATAGLQRRTNLIWWKETLYSPSARVSYRGMPTSTAAALMAFDLHQQVPTFSPASVAAFLHETVLTLPSLDAAEARPIHDLLHEATDSQVLTPLREAAALMTPEPAGRGPLLGLLGHCRSPVEDQKFRARVGVPATTPLTIPEWATWLFRELQAARATKEGSEAKKRGRRS
jgi:hypothetical protein